MHKVYCILGRTASGKSSITKQAAKSLGYKVLKSYTTRGMRKGETEENSDHTFISPEEVNMYREDMVAYTDRVGYCSFATKQQLLESDFYIINPSGYLELLEKTKDMNDIELVSIMINVSYLDNMKRAKQRGDFDSWKENYLKEEDEFKEFSRLNLTHYYVLNNTSIDDSVQKLIKIVHKEVNKDEK